MKKIWNFLKTHLGEDFSAGAYGTVAIFLVVAISLNYAFDFEDNIMSPLEGVRGFLAYCLFFGVPYYFSVAVMVGPRRQQLFKQRGFWIRSGFGIMVLALDASMPYLREIIRNTLDPAVQYWALKVAVNAVSFFTVMLPLLIFYVLHDRNEGHWYGLHARAFDARPYFMMLALLLPLLIAASFHESFLRQYPMYKTTSAHLHLGVSEWVTVAMYELAYGLDFVTVEFVFRGFFVLGLISLLGRRVVLPMAVIYCFLHFGKPAGEAVSSVFGGYILGVIAYETRSVWGGIIVHMGIAWLMELIAFIQKIFHH